MRSCVTLAAGNIYPSGHNARLGYFELEWRH